ncbi:uncharacterized protein C1orf141 homolog [Trichechus manatus latirostris]|uniref:Uncharacterized protein C1orf141 homolog n=1 Tax=Trichechus manatus latirostris TaxID=127582 RepID=A0A2Y9FW99_TRIMA|nr:uncharacterized protein C1orf141 homolog [Trichechus manatus latirostris]
MAAKILEKLDILNDQEKILLAQREKINRLQTGRRKKSLISPLTFDFQFEFEQPTTKSTLKTVSRITEDKSHDIKKQRRCVSFKSEPDHKRSHFEKSNLRPYFLPTKAKKQDNKSIERLQPVKENLKSRSIRPFLFLKDTSEVENRSHELYSYNGPAYRKPFGSSIFSPVLSIRSNAYKKERDSTLFRESKSTRNDQLTEHCSVRKKALLPLCFEDELKKSNAKIININSPKTAVSQMEKNYTNPIIFHETRYVQMLLLTKNKFPLHPMGSENIYPHKRTNFTLERNCGVLKSLTSGQSITPSNLKRTVPTAWRKNIQTTPFEVKCRVVEDKLKRKNNKPILENRSWSKLHNFSQTFSSLTKKFVGFLDKTVIQERNTKTGKFERMFSTTKPMNSHKFSASTVKSCSKPLKNILKVHKLNNITPLDDLLNFSSKA